MTWVIPIDEGERAWWRKVATPELAQRLTAQIADTLVEGLDPMGVAVVVEAGSEEEAGLHNDQDKLI